MPPPRGQRWRDVLQTLLLENPPIASRRWIADIAAGIDPLKPGASPQLGNKQPVTTHQLTGVVALEEGSQGGVIVNEVEHRLLAEVL